MARSIIARNYLLECFDQAIRNLWVRADFLSFNRTCLTSIHVLDQLLAEGTIDISNENHHHCPKNHRHGQRKGSPIEHWVDTSSWPFATTAFDAGTLIPPFPNETASIVPHCFSSIQSLSGVSTASSESLCYQTPLDYRGIRIYRNDPPESLIQKATQIITQENDTPSLHDEAALQELSKVPRRLWNASKEEVFEELGLRLTPGNGDDDHDLHPALACSIKRPWNQSVPVPLLPDFHTAPFLPDPAPDKAYGFSHDAFTHTQHAVIPTLTEPASDSDTDPGPATEPAKNHVNPDGNILFPFFIVEFASLATGNTHHAATDQASCAAAISLNGHLQLHRRTVGAAQFDHTQPWFFSLTMDQQIARLNVHWITTTITGRSMMSPKPQRQAHSRRPSTVSTRSFNTELLTVYLLNDMNALRDLHRAVCNVLQYGRDVLLPKLRLLLELCHQPYEKRSVSSNQTETGAGLEREQEREGGEAVRRPNAIDESAGDGQEQEQ
ncbi:hypothetical protein AJ79_00278 [Helicocarpus griseus UAMH5409]|uniref:DUF7924 domain-containing protein n=1 Tax=Helicocarpus griseus UAMH5409 TaxID=1447875 RepID=A0A2B7YC67_9EURO|nr:hypothetical protein AJ79_00278 [Helicocarpus griseus UAMH5409]